MAPLIGFIVLLVVAAIIAVLMALTPIMVAPLNPNPVKASPFECGEIKVTRIGRWPIIMQYYGYLLMFLVLDALSMFIFISSFLTPDLIKEVIPISLAFIGLAVLALPYGLMLSRRMRLWTITYTSESSQR